MQDVYVALKRLANNQIGETPSARRMDAAVSELVAKAMAGSKYHQQVAAEVMSRGTRL